MKLKRSDFTVNPLEKSKSKVGQRIEDVQNHAFSEDLRQDLWLRLVGA